jgi:predicted RNase H-like nuclease
VSVCVFVLVWSIEHFTVLEVVRGLVELHQENRDLRDQLKEKEAEVAYLKMALSSKFD